jgi:DNA-binding transcriptional regulator YhcF (GntR family)
MEFGDSNAIYLQIADQLSENILLRRWNPGDRIPSVRELAVGIEVNPNTVMRTFNYLQEKGIIYNKRGIGYFVSDDGFEKTKALRKENFLNQELPRLFRELRLLNLTMEDLSNFYSQYAESKIRNVNTPNDYEDK